MLDLVKVPLAILVVCIHLIGPEARLTFVVPCFFFISGYLFFLNMGTTFSWKQYADKIKRRIPSLLLPFIVWNLLYCAYCFLFDNDKLMANIDGKCWIRIFWDSNNNGDIPILGPLWYVRDLFVCIAFVPAVYFISKYAKLWSLLFVAFLLYMGSIYRCQITILQNGSISYFFLGAYCGLYKYDVTKYSNYVAFPLVLLNVLVFYFAFCCTGWQSSYMQIVYILSMGFMCFCLAERAQSLFNAKIPKPFDNSSFFVYCAHMFFYKLSFAIPAYLALEHGARTIAVPIDLMLCFASYYLLWKFMPKVLNFLCGQR